LYVFTGLSGKCNHLKSHRIWVQHNQLK